MRCSRSVAKGLVQALDEASRDRRGARRQHAFLIAKIERHDFDLLCGRTHADRKNGEVLGTNDELPKSKAK